MIVNHDNKGIIKYEQYRFIGEIVLGKARVVIIVAETMMIYHRCLSKSKLGLKVLLNKILSKLKSSDYFLAFTFKKC